MDGRCHRASALHTSRVYYVLRVPSRYQSRICFLRDPSRPWRLGGSHFQPVVSVTLYLGSYERESHGLQATAGSSTIYHKTVHRHSIGGFAVYARTEESGGGSVRLSTILKDHLGSTDRIVTGTWNGTSFANHQTERQSFDPWGERRDPATFVNFRSADTDPFRTSAADYDRGYTGHEQLDDSGLIHMNGRIYDPELGRMLSPDPFVQVPEYSQNFNRYSYVLNNPLNKTDPTGYSWLSKAFDKVGDWFSENWRTVVVIVVIAIVTIVSAGSLTAGAYAVGSAVLGGTAASAVTSAVGAWAVSAVGGAFLGGIAGGLSAALAGGDLGDVLLSATIGGVQGALTAGGLHALDPGSGGLFRSPGKSTLHIAGHGVVGGAANEAMGGKFQDGFYSAAASAAAADLGAFGFGGDDNLSIAARTAAAGIVGGTASAIGGGKFSNGAFTAAFQHYLNAEGGKMTWGGKTYRFFTMDNRFGPDPRLLTGKWWGPEGTYYELECASGAQYWCGTDADGGRYDAPETLSWRKGPEVLSGEFEAARQAAVDSGQSPYLMIAKSDWSGPGGSYKPGHTIVYLGTSKADPNMHYIFEQYRTLPSGARVTMYPSSEIQKYNLVLSEKQYDSRSKSFTQGGRHGY